MKRNLLIVLFLTSLFYVKATPIDQRTAQNTASTFFSQTISATGKLNTKGQKTAANLVDQAQTLTVTNPESHEPEVITPYYIFNSEDEGFVIIAGDDRATPILGYCDEGHFNTANMPIQLKMWLDQYTHEIVEAIANNLPTNPETLIEWARLEKGVALPAVKGGSVSSLIKTKWDQAPIYNDLCPTAKKGKTVVGCVATAMAQVMKYWNAPKTGSGFKSYKSSSYGTLSANFGATTYQWSSMPNSVSSSSTSAQKKAVATLMYHCGISVDMNYGTSSEGGSGAYSKAIAPAFQNYFSYKSSTREVKKSAYSTSDWMNLIKQELDAKRPVVYYGSKSGGHCFVCDGYNANNYFHFNWGWSGICDGYYALTALKPTTGGIGSGGSDYTNNQGAIIGIEPGIKNEGTTPDPIIQKFDLQLYTALNIDETSLRFCDPFSFTVNVSNEGNKTFSGSLAIGIINSNGNFVNFMETINNINLGKDECFASALVFANSGSAQFVPGQYQGILFYKESTSSGWKVVGDGEYSNSVSFRVYYNDDIEMNSGFTVTTNSAQLISGKSATIKADIINNGASTFYGQYRLSLSNLDGSLAQSINIKSESQGLKSGYSYNPGISFTGNITVTPGTYLLELAYNEKNTDTWYYVGSRNYTNPVYIIVKAADLQQDNYESNNTQATAYTLPIYFSRDRAVKMTENANFHIGSDTDFYKIILPEGYKYNIYPLVYDILNPDESTYTADAFFAYSTDGVNYSEIFDDGASGFSVNNGGTVYFKLTQNNAGSLGSYKFKISLNRTVSTAIQSYDNDAQYKIKIYPNPAQDIVHITSLTDDPIQVITLYDINGKIVKNLQECSAENTLSLSGISTGIYVLQISCKQKVFSKKLIIKK